MSRPSRWSAAHPLFLGILTVVVVFLGLGSWSTMTTLSGAIIAPGQIVLLNTRQVIQHPEGGVVKAIYVTEGQQVKLGDLLMRLEGEGIKAELQFADARVMELGAIDARLDAQLNGVKAIEFDPEFLVLAASDDAAAEVKDTQERVFKQKLDGLSLARTQRYSRISDVRNQLFALTAEQEALQTQIDLQTEAVATHATLEASGLVKSDELFELKMHLAELQAQKSQLQADAAALTGQITQLEIDLQSVVQQFNADAEAELQSITSQEAEETARADALRERVKDLEIRAPIAGVVLGMQVTRPRTVVRAAEPLMYVIPENGPFLVDTKVPVTDIDEVFIDQSVNLVLNRDKSGQAQEMTGSVFRVSADVLQDDRTGAPYYLVSISISASSIKALNGVDLQPGMPVTAYLGTTSHTPLEYLLKPYIDYFRNAFRET